MENKTSSLVENSDETYGGIKMEYKVKVTVDLTVDLKDMGFPKDNGVLIWTPWECIIDYISHGLFKGHDATYMSDISEGIEFDGCNVEFPEELSGKLAKILLKNLWEHLEDDRGKKLHDEYQTLEEAIRGEIKKVTKVSPSMEG